MAKSITASVKRASFLCLVGGGFLLLAGCDRGSSDTFTAPTAPTSNTTTISIVGQRGSQSFSPNAASAGGRMVVWRNDDRDTHRIVANDGSFDTGDIAPGATSTMVQMPRIGLNYYCLIHPTTMFGAIGGGGGEAPRHVRASTAIRPSRTKGKSTKFWMQHRFEEKRRLVPTN